jgi:hypothetical protein
MSFGRDRARALKLAERIEAFDGPGIEREAEWTRERDVPPLHDQLAADVTAHLEEDGEPTAEHMYQLVRLALLRAHTAGFQAGMQFVNAPALSVLRAELRDIGGDDSPDPFTAPDTPPESA